MHANLWEARSGEEQHVLPRPFIRGSQPACCCYEGPCDTARPYGSPYQPMRTLETCAISSTPPQSRTPRSSKGSGGATVCSQHRRFKNGLVAVQQRSLVPPHRAVHVGRQAVPSLLTNTLGNKKRLPSTTGLAERCAADTAALASLLFMAKPPCLSSAAERANSKALAFTQPLHATSLA